MYVLSKFTSSYDKTLEQEINFNSLHTDGPTKLSLWKERLLSLEGTIQYLDPSLHSGHATIDCYNEVHISGGNQ